MMNGWDMSGWGWAWMSVWMLIGVVVIALLVALVTRGPETLRPVEDEALATLRRRFAAGEIDETEYARRREALGR